MARSSMPVDGDGVEERWERRRVRAFVDAEGGGSTACMLATQEPFASDQAHPAKGVCRQTSKHIAPRSHLEAPTDRRIGVI